MTLSDGVRLAKRVAHEGLIRGHFASAPSTPFFTALAYRMEVLA